MNPSFKKYPILVVDDHLENIQVVGKLLKDQGYIVYFSRSGEEALEVVRTQPIQLVLLDVMMPGMDGFTAAEKMLRIRSPEHLPIIFLTALNEKDQVIKGFEVGGVDYITKPFNRGELLARVKTHLSLQRAQVEIQEKNKALEEAAANQDRFFSILAHDLKSPVSGIYGLVEEATQYSSQYTLEDFHGIIQALSQSSHQVYQLLNSLLSWGKSQVLSQTMKFDTIDAQSMVLGVLESLGNTAKSKKITISHSVQVKQVQGHTPSIQAILRNLLHNAIKFSPRGGEVEIKIWVDANFWFMEVSDHGQGMSQIQVNKLFKIGEKVSTLGTENEAGTGLGLVLCQELAQKHFGTIKVESEKNIGTQFTLILPLNPSGLIPSE